MPVTRLVISRALCTIAAGMLPLLAVGAQQAVLAAGALPATRPLGKVRATSAELLGAVSQVRALPDGRVLVNDNLGRKVVLYDSALKSFTVIADTTSATANAYSSRAGGLIAYTGDSSLFVDPTSLSMLVIDGKGHVARVMSVPQPNDVRALIGGPNGTPGFDGQGRLVYRSSAQAQMRSVASAPGAEGGTSGFGMLTPPESLAVVRIALPTRTVDTVGYVKIAKQNISVTRGEDGRMSVTATINPLPVIDDWAVTSDGRVCIVRGQEYRMDCYGATSDRAGSNKVPFAWKHLDDSAKFGIIDSTRKTMEVLRQQTLARAAGGGVDPGDLAAATGMIVQFGGVGARTPTSRSGTTGSRGAGGSGGAAGIQIPPLQFVNPSELPDYAPPFTDGSVRGDMDGNVWIRTTNTFSGGSEYDIVNSKYELTDRVLVPPGRVIAGFGKGVVYMGVREGAGGVRLEVAPIRSAKP
jgi:hypothetical protein